MWTTVISTVTKWALHLLASVSLLGLTWCGGHHAGAVAQRVKDAPVIARAQAAAATGQAQASLTTQVLATAAKRGDHERAIQQINMASAVALAQTKDGDQVVPPDVDALWRSGIDGLRNPQPGDGGDQGGELHGGPGIEGVGVETFTASRAAN